MTPERMDNILDEAFEVVCARWSKKELPRDTKILLMYDQGKAYWEIAQAVKCTKGIVAGVINRKHTGCKEAIKQHFAKRPRSSHHA